MKSAAEEDSLDMANMTEMPENFEITSEQMVKEVMPLFHGPFVKMRLRHTDLEYTVSKPLLCKASPYFDSMFKDNEIGDVEQIITLDPIDGAVSKRSIEGVLQWIYTRQIHCEASLSRADEIASAIEIARLADLWRIAGALRDTLAERIKKAVLASRGKAFKKVKAVIITRQHIFSAGYLPQDHAVRRIVVQAAMGAFLRTDGDCYGREIREHPSFGADLLQELRPRLNQLIRKGQRAGIADPLDGKGYLCLRFCESNGE
ncbi:Uncharacterized protein PECH_007766 [Penicillium ucsense]|uniref:BTB domain-containing protein n=1 Tax=Penicillium ucsense TaxID=2839758 RepID=A0A8J8WM61_9EURO|nr:Uncharacterized protein PECM_004636 [Penicillium ucsense]KAF7734669.1 Uncharacterized protein PECH_007766 [Penicillium ucsense]